MSHQNFELPLDEPLKSVEHRVISGFWRRIAAFAFDLLLIWNVKLLLNGALHQIAGWNTWGKLLGPSIGFIYFVIQTSSLTGGKTLGQRLLKICVVAHNGAPISLRRSFLRSIILFLIPGITFVTFGFMPPPVGALIGYYPFIYLYLFNKPSRQSLHDLIMGTYVVNEIPHGTVEAPSFWKGHLIFIAPWFLIVGGWFAYLLLVFFALRHTGF